MTTAAIGLAQFGMEDVRHLVERCAREAPTAGKLPVDRKHLVPHQLLADDGQHLRARLVQPVHAFSPNVKRAGAAIDLAVTFDAAKKLLTESTVPAS